MKNDFRDYICHYGIKDMHWGERRFQNEDGSLTEAGAKRYGRKLSRLRYKYKSDLNEYNMLNLKADKYNKHVKLKRNRYGKRVQNLENKIKELEKEKFGKKNVKSLKVVDTNDAKRVRVNRNQKIRAIRNRLLLDDKGVKWQHYNDMANAKYYRESGGDPISVSGNDIFITLKDGRVIKLK